MDGPTFSGIEGFEMGEAFARGLALDGITTPTAIQVAAIPAILAGKHVVVQSGTGTGKTLAYLLPALQRLSKQPHAKLVVFAPAAELAIQTLRTLERYAPADLSSASLVAGGNIKAQKGRLQKSTRAIVGTPGRILDMVAERRLKGVTMVVLDEPEPILTGKDARFLVEVLSRPPRVQLILAAATLGPQSERLIAELMAENLVRANVADDPLAERIAHYFVSVRHAGAKDVRLARFLETNACQRAIVFANEGPTLRHLFRYLSEQGLSPVTVSQERAKLSCQQALAAFAKAEARVLLTTDTAATGLDIPEVDWVFHYELPHSAKAYRHRAGRTGRAGRAGSSVAIVTENEVPLLERYERELGIEFRRFGTRE